MSKVLEESVYHGGKIHLIGEPDPRKGKEAKSAGKSKDDAKANDKGNQ